MWKRPAPWVVPSLLVLLLSAAEAGELGETVVFPASSGLSFVVSGTRRPGEVLFDSGESAFLAEPWDTVIFQGLSPDAGVVFEAARKNASGAWTPWTAATVKRHAGGRFWGRAAFGTAAGSVRIRALAAAVTGPHAVSLFEVDVFASNAAEPSDAVGARAPAQWPARQPDMIARAGWGAKPPKNPYTPDEPKRLTVHHTAGPQPASLEDSIKEVVFIQDFHQNGRGWNDIAYHFLIDGAGNVFEGRPLGALGAHSLRANDNNVGVALLGTHHAPASHPFLAAKRASFVRLARWLAESRGVPGSSLKGHRDYRTTECPGDLVYAQLEALKKEITGPQPLMPAWLHERPVWDGLTLKR